MQQQMEAEPPVVSFRGTLASALDLALHYNTTVDEVARIWVDIRADPERLVEELDARFARLDFDAADEPLFVPSPAPRADLAAVVDLCLAGLHADGDHHKQHYLEEILRRVISAADFERVVTQVPERGVPP